MFVFDVQEGGLGFDGNNGMEREASHTTARTTRLFLLHAVVYSFFGEGEEKRNVLIKITLFFILY